MKNPEELQKVKEKDGSIVYKLEYEPKHDCCNHYKTALFTLGYEANPKTGKPSKFRVYICDNCGEVHSPYKGIKGWLAELYFRFISKGCIFIPHQEEGEENENI